MTDVLEVYKCEACGNIIEVLHAGPGELVCCGSPMTLMGEKSEDTGVEKHLPVIEKKETGYLVKVGSVTHPMLDEHYIEFIELVTPTTVLRKVLKSGDAPEAFFECNEENVKAREYCSIHGLWSKE